MTKIFFLKKEQIKDLIGKTNGYCFATDEIMVKGKKVGYMYREKHNRPDDSGWVFTAGTESPEYMDNPANTGIYSLNTLANYDHEIIIFLDSPVGSAFEREKGSGKFTKVPLITR